MQNKIFLELGSNIGDRLSFLKKAVKGISGNRHILINGTSSVYETEPWGISEQNIFLNMALEVSSDLPPDILLEFLKGLEKSIGRKNRSRWNEREIDIDIIFYGDKIFKSDSLTIPHPEMQKRNFVLIPLSELDGSFVHPLLGISIDRLLRESTDKLYCRKTNQVLYPL